MAAGNLENKAGNFSTSTSHFLEALQSTWDCPIPGTFVAWPFNVPA